MSDLLIHRHGRVLQLTLNRPQARNALNNALLTRIAEALEAAAVDDSVGVIQVGGVFEVVSNSCFRKMGLPHLKILIEVCAVSLRFRRAAPLVDAAEIGSIVYPARAIANDDRSAASDQHFTKGT